MKIEEKLDLYLNEAKQGFYVVSKRKTLDNDWIAGQRMTKKDAKLKADTLQSGIHSKDLTGLVIVKAQDQRDAVRKAKNKEWIKQYIYFP